MRHCTGCSDNREKRGIRHTEETSPSVGAPETTPCTPVAGQGHPSEPQRRWLILAHCFNMDGRAASQTITDRIPFFLKHGIEPVVLSAPTGNRDSRFPHHQVFSASPSCFLFEVRQIINKKTPSHMWRHFLKTTLTFILLPFYVLEKIFVHLDSHWSWAISATYSGRRLIKKYVPELIYSSGGASSAHLAGFFLHSISGLPWLAELHDPLCYTYQPLRGQKVRFHSWLEKIIARHANAVVFFTEQARNHACGRQPTLALKATVLRPGANPPNFSKGDYRKADQIHIGHFGSLAPDRNLKVIFEAIAELIQAKPEWRKLILLHIYGTSLDPFSASAMTACQLEELVVQHGRLEYDPYTRKSGRQQILEAMRQSDILLLLHGGTSTSLEYIPSKLYEYLLVHRPILGFTPPGSELAELLEGAGHCTLDPDDHLAVQKAFSQIIQQWQNTGLSDLQPAFSFTVDAAVNQLVQIVEKITPHFMNNPTDTQP